MPLPSTCFVELQYGCNLKCGYCYVGEAQNYSGERPIPTGEEWSHALERLQRLGVRNPVFLGGEPLLYPHLVEVIEHATKMGFASVGILSNGTLLSRDLLERLGRAGVWLNITLRGARRDTWQLLTRNTAVWDRVDRGLALLANVGVTVAIEYDCTPLNYDQLIETAQWVRRHGLRVSHFQLHRIAPRGDGAASLFATALTPTQWEEVLAQADVVNDELGIPVVMEDGLPLCVVSPKHWAKMRPCGCGWGSVLLTPEFRLKRCGCDQESLVSIFDEESLVYSALSESRIRPVLEPCDTCHALPVCRGGCPSSVPSVRQLGNDIYQKVLRPVSLQDWLEYGNRAPFSILGHDLLQAPDLGEQSKDCIP